MKPIYGGILPSDTRDDVQQKMGRPPAWSSISEDEERNTSGRAVELSTEDSCEHWEKYKFPPLEFTFIYESMDRSDLSEFASQKQLG